MTDADRAEQLFNTYNAQGPNPWKTFDGREVPRWEQCGAQVQGKWIAVALAARVREHDSPPPTEERVDPLFATHLLNDRGIARAKLVAQHFQRLLRGLEEVCGAGREFALARTHLEQASFYAKKSMAMVGENQRAP